MRLEIDESSLKVYFNTLETIVSFQRFLSIPFANIEGVSTDKPGWTWGTRSPGTYIPFLVKAGSYYTSNGREFWCTTAGKPCLVLFIENWIYNRVVLSVSDNSLWAERIRSEIQQG